MEQTAGRLSSTVRTPRLPGRTLAVLHLSERSGPSESLVPDLEWLRRQGEVITVVPGQGEAAEAYQSLGGVDVLDYQPLTFPRGALGPVRVLAQLLADVRTFRRHLRRTRPDLVIAVTGTLPALLIAARAERVRALTYVGEIFEKGHTHGVRRRALNRLIVRATSRLSAGVLCCSETVAAQFDTEAVDVTILYPPIDDRYADGDREAFRSRYGLVDASPCLVAVGNLTAGRGQDVLVRALALMSRELEDARVVIVGAPHPREQDRRFAQHLKRLAAELGVVDAVVFTGFVDRIADAYAAADIVVNPARFNEPFGRAACEALTASRPVIASSVGAIPEVLQDREHALLVAPDDPRALADAVIELASDARLRERLVAAGRRHVAEAFGEAPNVDAFARAVERAMAT